jgi:hypothetical protein
MIPNFVSVYTIIAKVLSDLDLQETNHRLVDMINYAAEAVEHIGAIRTLHFKKTGEDGLDHIRVKDYYVKLPKDLFKLATVLYSPSTKQPTDKSMWFQCRVSSDSLGASHDKLTHDPVYVMRSGALNLNKRDGWVKLAYYAFPTDCNGYPLIPDTATYQEAVYWYIATKLLYPQWLKGQVRDAVYAEAKANWVLFRNNAYAESMMPTQDELISLGNQWIKLVPDPNSYMTQYSGEGQQEHIFNKDKGNYNIFI